MKKSLLAPTVAAAAAVLLAVPGNVGAQSELTERRVNRTFETCFEGNNMRNQVGAMNSMVDAEITKLRSEGTYEHEATMRRAATQNIRSAIQDKDPATIEKLNELIIQLGMECFKQGTDRIGIPVTINGVTRDPETGEVTHGGFEFGEKE